MCRRDGARRVGRGRDSILLPLPRRRRRGETVSPHSGRGRVRIRHRRGSSDVQRAQGSWRLASLPALLPLLLSRVRESDASKGSSSDLKSSRPRPVLICQFCCHDITNQRVDHDHDHDPVIGAPVVVQDLVLLSRGSVRQPIFDVLAARSFSESWCRVARTRIGGRPGVKCHEHEDPTYRTEVRKYVSYVSQIKQCSPRPRRLGLSLRHRVPLSCPFEIASAFALGGKAKSGIVIKALALTSFRTSVRGTSVLP